MNGLSQINPAFWSGKRVLVTGHTGFKGSWLSIWLQAMGAELSGLALAPPTEPALFDVAGVAAGMDHHIVDIRNYADVASHMNAFKPDIVFHMAAQPLVRMSYSQPIETFETNVMGTVHILEAARHAKVTAIVNVTSDKCYENRESIWGYRENDPMGGSDPYSCSKGCSELVSQAYRRSFLESASISVATARAGNVIGGGDWAKDRLVPDVLAFLEKQETIKIRNPYAIRPWQHVLEPLSGYLLLAERLFSNGQSDAEGWNFGPNESDAQPVQWMVERLCGLWGGGANWALQLGDHPHEAGYLKLDISKARQRLSWSPRWSLEEALLRTIEWHKAWLDGKEMREVCLDQISDYISYI